MATPANIKFPTLVDDGRGYDRHHACAWSRLRFASMLYNHGRTWVKPHGTASIHVSMYAAEKKILAGLSAVEADRVGPERLPGAVGSMA